MKSLFMAISVIADLSILSLNSCTDESVLPQKNTSGKNEKITFRSNHLNRHYFDNGNPNGTAGTDFGCIPPAVTCFDDVVVTGQKLNVVNYIFSHISSWTTAQLDDYVDTNSSDLNDIMGSTETAGIAAGTYTLRTRGTELMSTRYLITKDGSSIVSVTPIEN